MDLLIDIITGLCFFIGSLSIIIGACGLIKLPDVFSRIHSAGMIDTAGAAFIILGMIFQSGISLATAKLVFIGIFIFFSSPVSSHVISRIHAAGMIDTGGTAFFLLGMILQTGWSLITVKLILIGVFVFFTSPVTSHVTANLARQKNLMPVGKKIGKLL